MKRSPTDGPQDDYQIDQMIGYLLRVGVYLAASVIVVGAGLYLYQHGADRVD